MVDEELKSREVEEVGELPDRVRASEERCVSMELR